ncbi:Hypothetical protein PACV_202 [Pacmanvirus A23]|uniref:Hypothetical protein n=1 Tax=Pacmanvirus A23 TaxID=1932881 RepID=UPI000A092FF6|nr:Hypothetical protein B9W72_gp200 [Pacmanvirus A23]SIP85917.1 Hypothetical protein PACV_202 [Pacmanvirus A23]
MDYQELAEEIGFHNLFNIEFTTDEEFNNVISGCEYWPEMTLYRAAITRCGNTVSTCQFLFNVCELISCKIQRQDIQQIITILDERNYMDFTVKMNNLVHAFVIIKHVDTYLVIQSFINQYPPIIDIYDKKELYCLFEDIFDLLSGKFENYEKLFYVYLETDTHFLINAKLYAWITKDIIII